MFVKVLANVGLLTFLLAGRSVFSADAQSERVALRGHVPTVTEGLVAKGRLPLTKPLSLSIGLPLRNQAELDLLLRELYDPGSTNFHRFLTPPEFTSRFGPTEEEYQAVIAYMEANGLTVSGRYSNRVVLDVSGGVANVEKAFKVTLRTYRHPREPRDFFAPDVEPSVPTNLPVVDMWGLTDYGLPRPLSHKVQSLKSTPLNYNGSGPGGAYLGNDFRNAYAPGTALNGAGQIVAVAEFDGYYQNDITNYEALSGYPNVTLQNVLVSVSGTPGYSGQANAVAEVSLDIELAIAMAPGMSKLMVYEGSSPYNVFNKIATDNAAKQISCSWAWNVGPTHIWSVFGGRTLDSQLQQMASQGQSFFQASGDSDAYTGAQSMNSSTGPIPVDSIYVTSVGGTTLTMTGTGSSWSSETVWNWGNNVGSSGGISPNYPIPSWQTNVSMAANGGSTSLRNVPDVALTADAVHVIYNNGSVGAFGGTSCAAPLWAGFCALVNQQSIVSGGSTVGLLNPALYAIGAGPNYSACFHDVTTGNNIGTNTPGLYNAVTNYDLATGLGTPNGTNLINVLAPPPLPYFITQPTSRTVSNGMSVVLSATAGGKPTLKYQWLFNGTNLPTGGNVSGTTSNVLSITSATSGNAGNYSLIVTNNSGSATSSVTVLVVGSAPAFWVQPAGQTVLSGSNAVFTATASGSAPLAFQWRKNGTNLVNGGGISGATTNTLTLAGVTTNSSGNYSLVVTNGFGTATSSVATLTVVLPPQIISSTLTNLSVQCGSNSVTFGVTASGTAPLNFQWSLDGVPVANQTNTSFSLVNVHLPNHTVAVTATNLYGRATNNALVTVLDTFPPVVTLNGTNSVNVELGNSFTDPGATAADVCAGSVSVFASGNVNTNVVGTNVLAYSANDGNGNSNTVARTVIVRDTTPPVVLWSFTNLVLAADTNCSAVMPDVTGTNFIQATDVSGVLTVSQIPTNGAALLLGTNTVILSVTDASGNAAYSTNTVIVQDQTPPQIVAEPLNQTNFAGTTVTISINAGACTPLTYQWSSNNVVLTSGTNVSLTISNLSPAAAGSYFVVVSSSGGSTTSAVVTLTVILPPSTVAAISSSNPSGFLDNLNFTATVTPTNAGGSIQFYTNGAAFDSQSLIAGQAVSVGVSSLPRGTNVIGTIYSGDANHLPSTDALLQIVTNHPPTAASVFYSRVSGSVLTIAVTNLATNWVDIDGDSIALADVSVSTNGITLVNDGGTLTYSNATDVADQFVCTIADGFGGTNFQTVNIAVVTPISSTPNIVGAAHNPDGSFTLSFTGSPDDTYVLEATSSLSSGGWAPIATNSPDSGGTWQFTDLQTTNSPRKFYRLMLVQ